MTEELPTVPPAPPQVILLGRTMVLRRPTAAQLMMLHRAQKAVSSAFEAYRAETDKTARDRLASQGLVSGGGLLDVIERLIVNHDDRTWLTEQFMEGTLDLDALMPIIRAVQDVDEDGEEPAKPVKKAARGAARKS